VKNLVLREPVLTQGVVQAVLGLVLAFGVDLSSEQTGAILAVTAAVLALVTRQVVTPTAEGDDG
jgi:hypothetical protein